MSVPAAGDRGFFGHPRGLSTLFFTEMWERFSYYGMRALLILFMTASVAQGGLGWDAKRAATTFGYGPRFLHSTGQFHKGGPRTGRFLQLLHDAGDEVEIPGAGYTFTTLKNAQAIGDLRTLRELALPAERVRLRGEDPAAAVRALAAALAGAEVSDEAREGGIR